MNRRTKFKVDSGYLQPALDLKGLMPSFTIRRLIISSGSRGAEGAVQIDPNSCALDEFGAPAGCTRIATRLFPAKVKLLQTSPDGRQLYSVEPKGYTGPPLRVALRAPDAGDEEFVAQLLVLGDDSIQRIVSLKAAPKS